MFQEYERTTIKRQVTPDPSGRDFQNLGRMQENLRIAAHTIEALQQERDRLKRSFKSIVPRSPGFYSKEGSSEENEDLKKILESQEKNIENLEKQVFEAKIKSADMKTLQENNEKLKKEILEREKNTIRLEKIIRDLKAEKFSQAESSEFKENDRRIIESLQKEIADLQQVKKNWKKIVEILGSISSGLIQGSARRDREKNDWEMVCSTIFAMKNKLDDKETGPKSTKKNEAEKIIQDLRDQNRRLLEELENKELKTQNSNIFDLHEMAFKFITKVKQNQAQHLAFKKYLFGSSFFRSLLEKNQHSEALLRVLRFILEYLDQGNKKRPSFIDISDEESSKLSYTPRETIRKRIEIEKQRCKAVSPSSSETARMLNTWTQTNELDKSKIYNFKVNPAQQISLDKSSKETKPPRVSKDTKRASNLAEAKDFQSNLEKYTDSHLERPTMILEHDGYIKLFDESEQLLSIIDKQSSRLSKINSQISNLVPNAFENLKDLSGSSDDNKEFKKNYLKVPQGQYEEGTFGRCRASLNTDSEKAKGFQNSDRASGYINSRLSPGKGEASKGCTETPQFERDENLNIEEEKFTKLGVKKGTAHGEIYKNLEGGLYFDFKESSDDFNESLDGSEAIMANIKKGKNNKRVEGATKLAKNSARLYQTRFEDKPEDYWNNVADYFSNRDDQSK